jgi:predicted Zn-dependent protease with MMP-like domain
MIYTEQIFQESYEVTLAMLELRSKNKLFKITSLKGELDTLYVYEGLDWTGRGEIKNSEISGEIAAYQVFLHNYFNKEEQGR